MGWELEDFYIYLVTKENSQHVVDYGHVHCSLIYP